MKQNNKTIKSFDGVLRKRKTISHKEETFSTSTSLRYVGLKLSGVFVLATLLLISISSIGGTISYFNDSEFSIGNFLRADPLSFKVDIASSTSVQVDLSNGNSSVTPIMTPDPDSEPIQYFVKSKYTGGDLDLCNSIQLLSTWPFPYTGSISSLNTSTSTTIGAWTLDFSLSNPINYSNKSCTLDLVYEGWNAGAEYGKGYRDTKTISLTFYVNDIAPKLSLPVQSLTAPESQIVEPEEEVVEDKPQTPNIEENITETSVEPVVEIEIKVEETPPVEQSIENTTPPLPETPTPEVSTETNAEVSN